MGPIIKEDSELHMNKDPETKSATEGEKQKAKENGCDHENITCFYKKEYKLLEESKKYIENEYHICEKELK